MNEQQVAKCELCGEPMPPGEQMFKFHGYSGPCPRQHIIPLTHEPKIKSVVGPIPEEPPEATHSEDIERLQKLLHEREGEPLDDAMPDTDKHCYISCIEVAFHIPVYMTIDQQRRLCNLVQEICERPCNTPVGGVHWQSGGGSKPLWDEPHEPDFDNSIYYVETFSRSK